jgi:hypothetical protein
MQLPQRLHRRTAGLLHARLPELKLHTVPEVRHRRGKRRWPLPTLLKAVLVGLVSGCKGFSEMEELTDEMSRSMRRMLGIPRRLPDTTARDVIVRLQDTALRPCLYAQVQAARRRKALAPEGLPFGVVAIDGKATAIDAWDERYSQRQRHSEDDGVHGIVRTLSCTLVSSRAKVYLDAVAVPPRTNETGAFPLALQSLRDAYGPRLPFQVVAADAAQCTRANDELVCEAHGLDYLFRLKDSQPTLYAEATRLIGPRHRTPPVAESHEVHKPYEEYRRLYVSSEIAGFDGWRNLRTVLRVVREQVQMNTGEVLHQGTRYFTSSLPAEALSPAQWMHLVRCYWAVENEGHNSLDTALAEDERPWITASPQGMVAVLLLRRMAYNLLALFRSVTLRSDENRLMPWGKLLRRMRTVMVSATEDTLAGLRDRKRADAFSC